MEILKLSKPIMIDGKEVKELPYDFDNLTAQDKVNAGKEYKAQGGMISVQELDSDYHLYLFAAAVKKANDEIGIIEVLRIPAKDSVKAEALARDFFFLGSEDTSPTNTSTEQ